MTERAIWYIESHLGEQLSLETIADAICVSRFHLCRAFPNAIQSSLSSYVRARRLSKAAKALAEGAPDILALALEAGYGSHEAFTRAFRQHFGLTPEQLRARAATSHIDLQEPIRMQPTVFKTIPPPRLVKSDALLIFGVSEHYNCKSTAGIPSQWSRFLPHFCHIQGQIGRIAYGVIYNPDSAGNIDYLTGVEVSEFPSHPAQFARLRIPPETYAVFEHRDHVSSINATWTTIWEHALAASGYQATDGPSFERYGEEFDGRTGLGGAEIWIPVKA